MIKRLFSYLVFTALVIFAFNLLDFLFDTVFSHTSFTFNSLSNILLPIIIAILIITFFALYKKFVK